MNTTTKHLEATMNNNKIKHLLDTAYKTDLIAKNKWRIENREQLREQRKKELKELMEKDKTMSNNKQGMEQLKELMTISWRQGFMNGLLAGSIICAIISTLIITIVL